MLLISRLCLVNPQLISVFKHIEDVCHRRQLSVSLGREGAEEGRGGQDPGWDGWTGPNPRCAPDVGDGAESQDGPQPCLHESLGREQRVGQAGKGSTLRSTGLGLGKSGVAQ